MKNKMEKKYLAATCVLLVTFSVLMALPPVFAEDTLDDVELASGQKGTWRPLGRLRLLIYIIRNSVPETVTGDSVALEGYILMMNVKGDLENVILPDKWVLDGEITTLQELYGEYMSGSEITIHTLKVELVQESKTITVYFGYKIEAGGVFASAMLPFNVHV